MLGELSHEQIEDVLRAQVIGRIGRLVARLAPLMASETARPTHGADTSGRSAVLFRIRLTERTGRFEAR